MAKVRKSDGQETFAGTQGNGEVARKRPFHSIYFRRSHRFNRADAPAIVVETQAPMPVMTPTPTASSYMPMTPKPRTPASQPTGNVRPRRFGRANY
jgi:hypothetical protein